MASPLNRETFYQMEEPMKLSDATQNNLEQPWTKWWYNAVSSKAETVIWPVMIAGNGRHHTESAIGADLGVPKARPIKSANN